MSIRKQKIFMMLAVALLAMGMTIPAVQADDGRDGEYGERHDERGNKKYSGENRGRPFQPEQTNVKFQQECSTCHIAYPPGMLPAESWRKIMAGLDKHFGSDASLDDQDNKEITAFLVNNASNRWSAQTAPLRISEAAWFGREHNERKINPAIWKNTKVNSQANCAACHPRAERGDFNEHDTRMPR